MGQVCSKLDLSSSMIIRLHYQVTCPSVSASWS